MFKKKEHVKKFLRRINSCHLNIKFPWKDEKDNKISFLDISISRNNNALKTSIFRKPIFSGVHTNFDSFLPTEYKKVWCTRCYTEHVTFVPAICRFMKKLIIWSQFCRKTHFLCFLLTIVFIIFWINYSLNVYEILLLLRKEEITISLEYLGNMTLLAKKQLTNIGV